ncbi:MAG: hypothetical protein M1839_003775 [Geoglossum umbratile]|nr:MAG: hypothetical protein M1839_003775 [Geoglossum umbratile]
MHTRINLAIAIVALSSVSLSAPLKYEARMDPSGHSAMALRIREIVPGELEALAGSLRENRVAGLSASAKNGAGVDTPGAKAIGGENPGLSSKINDLLEGSGGSSGASVHTREEKDLEFLSDIEGEGDTADESYGRAAEQTDLDIASLTEDLFTRLEQDIADQLRRQTTNTPAKRNTDLLSSMGHSVEHTGVSFEEELFGRADPNKPRDQNDGARVTVTFGGAALPGAAMSKRDPDFFSDVKDSFVRLGNEVGKDLFGR